MGLGHRLDISHSGTPVEQWTDISTDKSLKRCPPQGYFTSPPPHVDHLIPMAPATSGGPCCTAIIFRLTEPTAPLSALRGEDGGGGGAAIEEAEAKSPPSSPADAALPLAPGI